MVSMAKKTETRDKTLIIVESPTKAKTIRKFLPSDMTVMACNGHIRDLPSKDLAIDVEKDYEPKYEISRGKEKIIKELKAQLKDADTLLLATDEDREGESISWHLLQVLRPKVPHRRMVFHEITKKAITHALEQGRDVDMNLVNAQEARRILDRLYGYTLSPFLWKKLSMRTLSAGRVQSPGLRLIVERERERIAFRSGTYFDVLATLNSKEQSVPSFEAKLEAIGETRIASGKDFDPATGELKSARVTLVDETAAEDIAQFVKNATWRVTSVSEKEKKSRPAPPFITSTLQQEGSRKLRLSATETMRIAQRLYENGLITYMRTDSPSLSDEAINGAREAVTELYGQEFLSPGRRVYTSKDAQAQEAHEAIRPAGDTFVHPDDSKLSGKDLALYSMIWKRTLATQMADAVKATTSVRLEVGEYRFSATGNRIVFPGFIRVYVEGRDDPEAALEDTERLLPLLSEDTHIEIQKAQSQRHETKPPTRFSEATLVQELEKRGIGRPSTYAAIIEKLYEKEYIDRENNALIPTFVGFAVVQLLERNFEKELDYDFTSSMESILDDIARGQMDRRGFLRDFYEGQNGLRERVAERLDAVDHLDAKQIVLTSLPDTYTLMVGKFGPYIKDEQQDLNVSIPKGMYPGTISEQDVAQLFALRKNEVEDDSPLFIHPDTKEPIYLLTGRYGPYFQAGKVSDENKKPPRVSLPRGREADSMSEEEILFLFSLPKSIGADSESGEDIKLGVGRYGPYISCSGTFHSVKDFDTLRHMSREEAERIIHTSPKGKGGRAKAEPIKSYGEIDGKELAVYDGRYGLYGKYGKDNFALPQDLKADAEAVKALSVAELLELFKAYTPKKKPRKKK